MKLLKISVVAASALACSASFAAMPMGSKAGYNNLTTKVNRLNRQVRMLRMHRAKSAASTVSISGGRAFDGSDTVSWQSGYNLNYYLLQHNHYAGHDSVRLSGVIGTTLDFTNGDSFASTKTSSKSQQTLSGAKLDAAVSMSPWVSGFVSLGVNKRSVSPSTFAVQQAFVTYGNLARSHFFATVGLMYVPFGRFAGYTVINPMTQTIFQSQRSMLEVGYAHRGFVVEGYGFKGDAAESASNSVDKKWQGGVNAQMTRRIKNANLTVGAGYISNVAENTALGILNTTGKVPGYDVHARLCVKSIDVLGEFMSSNKKVVSTDKGNLSTYNVQAAYKFNFKSKPMYFGVAYGESKNASTVASADYGKMPKSVMSVFVDGSVWKNADFKIQYAHAKAYATYAGNKTSRTNQSIIAGEFNLYF